MPSLAAKDAGENSATNGVPAPPNRRGRSPPLRFQLPPGDALGVVDDRVLPRRQQHLDLGLPLGAGKPVHEVEQLTARQVPEIHGNSQTPTTDTDPPTPPQRCWRRGCVNPGY